MDQNIFSGKSNDEVKDMISKMIDDNQSRFGYGRVSNELDKVVNAITNKINKNNIC